MVHWLAERKSSVLFVSILAVLLILISYHAEGKQGQSRLEEALFHTVAPILKTVDGVAAGLGGLRDRFATLGRLRRENRALRDELSRARNVDDLREEYRLENERLRRVLGLQEALDFPTVAAIITRRPDDELYRAAILSLPADAGVTPQMPVVSPDGLVGQIRTVAGGKATVHLITDRNSGISVVAQRSRVQGIASGRGGGGLEMAYVVRGADIRPGDLILTSGLDGIFPKGIAVGIVARVRSDEGLTQRIEVDPAVPFDRLEEVLILLKPADDLPAEEPGGVP